MPPISKDSSSSANKTTRNTSTQRSSSVPKDKPTTTRKEATPRQPADQAHLSKEKGKAGATPDFGASFGSKPLRKGAEGDNVKQIQEMLNAKGAKLDVDGKFGQKTMDAVKAFQEKQNLKSDGIIGKDTIGKLQGGDPAANPDAAAKKDPAVNADPTKKDPAVSADPTKKDPAVNADPAAKADPAAPADPTKANGAIDLPQGYESLEKLSGELNKRDPRFNTTTPEGRSATALALAIGGTEMYGKGKTGTDFFTSRGGTGNNMLGFAQFNQKYHASKTNTPEKYTKYLGNILNGDARMPNSKAGGNHVGALTEAVKSGKIKTGEDLRAFMKQRGFGGSNWQGIDDGWGRNPGLANALVGFLKQS